MKMTESGRGTSHARPVFALFLQRQKSDNHFKRKQWEWTNNGALHIAFRVRVYFPTNANSRRIIMFHFKYIGWGYVNYKIHGISRKILRKNPPSIRFGVSSTVDAISDCYLRAFDHIIALNCKLVISN